MGREEIKRERERGEKGERYKEREREREREREKERRGMCRLSGILYLGKNLTMPLSPTVVLRLYFS